MEAGLVERGRGHVNKVGYVKRVIVKKRKPYRKVKKPVLTVPRALQELFDSCIQTFKGPGTVPSPQDVQKLCQILVARAKEELQKATRDANGNPLMQSQ